MSALRSPHPSSSNVALHRHFDAIAAAGTIEELAEACGEAIGEYRLSAFVIFSQTGGEGIESFTVLLRTEKRFLASLPLASSEDPWFVQRVHGILRHTGVPFLMSESWRAETYPAAFGFVDGLRRMGLTDGFAVPFWIGTTKVWAIAMGDGPLLDRHCQRELKWIFGEVLDRFKELELAILEEKLANERNLKPRHIELAKALIATGDLREVPTRMGLSERQVKRLREELRAVMGASTSLAAALEVARMIGFDGTEPSSTIGVDLAG